MYVCVCFPSGIRRYTVVIHFQGCGVLPHIGDISRNVIFCPGVEVVLCALDRRADALVL